MIPYCCNLPTMLFWAAKSSDAGLVFSAAHVLWSAVGLDAPASCSNFLFCHCRWNGLGHLSTNRQNARPPADETCGSILCPVVCLSSCLLKGFPPRRSDPRVADQLPVACMPDCSRQPILPAAQWYVRLSGRRPRVHRRGSVGWKRRPGAARVRDFGEWPCICRRYTLGAIFKPPTA